MAGASYKFLESSGQNRIRNYPKTLRSIPDPIFLPRFEECTEALFSSGRRMGRMHTERIAKESDRDPLSGTAYRTITQIDAGGMGVVLEAEHRKLRKLVCVKVLRHQSADFVDRMQLEAHSLAALDGHSNIVLERRTG